MKDNLEQTTKLKAGIEGLKRVSMTPRQKGEILHSLMKYTEKNPAIAKAGWIEIATRPLRSLFSLISWR